MHHIILPCRNVSDQWDHRKLSTKNSGKILPSFKNLVSHFSIGESKTDKYVFHFLRLLEDFDAPHRTNYRCHYVNPSITFLYSLSNDLEGLTSLINSDFNNHLVYLTSTKSYDIDKTYEFHLSFTYKYKIRQSKFTPHFNDYIICRECRWWHRGVVRWTILSTYSVVETYHTPSYPTLTMLLPIHVSLATFYKGC